MFLQKLVFIGIELPDYLKQKTGIKKPVYKTSESCIWSAGRDVLLLQSGLFSYLLLLIGSLVLYPVAWIYYLWSAVYYLFKKDFVYKIIEKIEIYKRDERGDCFKRIKKDKIVKTYVMSASYEPLARTLNRRKAFCYFCLLFVLYVIPLLWLALFG